MNKENFIKESIHFESPVKRGSEELKVGDKVYIAFVPHAIKVGFVITNKTDDCFILDGARMSADSDALYKNKNEAIDATIKLLMELKE